MIKQYTASVYSQKSTTSAKSGNSFLSWTSNSNKKKVDNEESKSSSVWKNVKSWIPKKNDTSRFKKLFLSKNSTTPTNSSPRYSIDDNTSSTLEVDEEEEKVVDETNNTVIIKPVGILINYNSVDAIKERKKQRNQRILKLQKLQFNDIENPRIMFLDSSPVPRFRNEAPPPPPSPPYLDILVNSEDEEEEENIEEHDRNISLLIESLKLQHKSIKLYFDEPLHKGQTIKFSLKNRIPTDHVILFKFLTTTVNTDRYFIKPSSGKIVNNKVDILLYLNQVPNYPIKKDKLIVRWVIIQRNTCIEDWFHSLQDSTRRRWMDMLDEQWPNQVTTKMTRIKIRFNSTHNL